MTLDADSIAVGRVGSMAGVFSCKGACLFRGDAGSVPALCRGCRRPGHRRCRTRFDVNLAAGGLTVTLVEGRVNVGARVPLRRP